jgi:hypothetical protein
MAQRECTVATQRLDILGLEVDPLHTEREVADTVEASVGEHVAVEELGTHRSVPPLLRVCDSVVEKQAV